MYNKFNKSKKILFALSIILLLLFITETSLFSNERQLRFNNDNNIINQDNNGNDEDDGDEGEALTEEELYTKINYNLSIAYDFYEEGKLEQAIVYLEKAKALIPSDNYELMAYYHNLLGKIHILMNDTGTAIENFVRADAYYKKALKTPAGKEKEPLNLSLADNLLELSIAHRKHGNLEEAIKKSSDALLVYESYGDIEGKAKALMSLANIYTVSGKLDDAEKSYNQALEIYKEAANFVSIGRIYNNLAVIYVKRGDYQTAIEYYNISINYKRDTEDYWGMALTYRNIAVLYEAMEDLRSAYNMMLECVKIATKYNDPSLEDYEHYLEFIRLRLES